jgi:hypothetical protein
MTPPPVISHGARTTLRGIRSVHYAALSRGSAEEAQSDIVLGQPPKLRLKAIIDACRSRTFL